MDRTFFPYIHNVVPGDDIRSLAQPQYTVVDAMRIDLLADEWSILYGRQAAGGRFHAQSWTLRPHPYEAFKDVFDLEAYGPYPTTFAGEGAPGCLVFSSAPATIDDVARMMRVLWAERERANLSVIVLMEDEGEGPRLRLGEKDLSRLEELGIKV